MTGSAFRFRLERVRAVRERKETLAKLELAGALSRLSSSEDDLRVVDEDLERALSEQRLATAESKSMSAAELLQRQTFLEQVELRRSVSADDLRRQAAEVVDRDAELSSAAGEHEMLKRLRERRREEHDREVAGRESNALDEIAVMRVRRGPV
ncbi:MAG TPA: flagellar export protein FliJ [Solirubrobacteraceae bacterium]|nr:flagellar export protein FliJ [Solirubrobacteraceae bacterium]